MNELDAADPLYLLGISHERLRLIALIKEMPEDIRIYKFTLINELFGEVVK